MVTKCIVRGCPNTQGMSKSIKLHRFPKNDELQKIWLEALDRGGSKANIHWRVCSVHFAYSDYEDTGTLKPNAIPSLVPYAKALPVDINSFSDESGKNKKTEVRTVAPLGKCDSSTGSVIFEGDVHEQQKSVRAQASPQKKTSADTARKIRLKRRIKSLQRAVNHLKHRFPSSLRQS